MVIEILYDYPNWHTQFEGEMVHHISIACIWSNQISYWENVWLVKHRLVQRLEIGILSVSAHESCVCFGSAHFDGIGSLV